MANRHDWPRNRYGKYVVAPVTMEDKLIEYYSDVKLAPHTCRGAAEYTGMSHAWCNVKWAEIRDRQEGLNKVSVETWRASQLQQISAVKEKMQELAEAGDPDAARALRALIETEMKLTGTARPVQVQLLPGPALEDYMKTLPAEVVAKVQAGDPKAIAEVKAGMQAWKVGG